ncbi:MAG: hypothetical protein ACYCZ8_00005, partial [Acidimicrobiales bacterium]
AELDALLGVPDLWQSPLEPDDDALVATDVEQELIPESAEIEEAAPPSAVLGEIDVMAELDALLGVPDLWQSPLEPDDDALVATDVEQEVIPESAEIEGQHLDGVDTAAAAIDAEQSDLGDSAPEEDAPAGIDDQAQDVDVDLLNTIVGWCNGPQAERLALALRLAGPEMARSGKVPIGAKIGTFSVELLFDQDVSVTEEDLPPAPWGAWPGMGSWVLTADVSISSLASASTSVSPFPALAPVGYDQNGLLLVNLGAYASVAITHSEAPTYLAAIEALLGPVIRAPWADGVTLLGNLPTDSDDVIVQVTGAGRDVSPDAACAVVMDPAPDTGLVLTDDGSCAGEMWRSLRSRPVPPPKKVAGQLVVNVLGPLVMTGHMEAQLMHKGLELVAMLVLSGGKMPVDTAIDALWDHERVARSTKSRLLRSTAVALGVGPSGEERFRTEGNSLVLSDVGCDWANFETNLAGSKEACFASLRGRPLENVTSEWAQNARFDISHKVVEASLDIALSAIDEGRLTSAEEVLERARRVAPFSDDLLSLVLDVAAMRGAGELESAWGDLVAQSGTGRENAMSPALTAKVHALRSKVMTPH